MEQVGGLCEHGRPTFGPIKCGEYINQLEKYRAFHNVLRNYKHLYKKKWPALMELFTVTGKLKKSFY
jgi:hypothetical protein